MTKKTFPTGEIILYQAPDKSVQLEVKLQKDTVWAYTGADGSIVWTRSLCDFQTHEKYFPSKK